MTYYRFQDDNDYDTYGVLGFDLDDTIENRNQIQEDIWHFTDEFNESQDNDSEEGYLVPYVIERLKNKYNCEVIVWDNTTTPLYI